MAESGSEATPATPVAGRFASTHWSIVRDAGGVLQQWQEALEQLCRTYWLPVYSYLRRHGKTPAAAEDITQAFFAHLVVGDFFAHPDGARGRFRGYRIGALKQFVGHERTLAAAAKRGGRLAASADTPPRRTREARGGRHVGKSGPRRERAAPSHRRVSPLSVPSDEPAPAPHEAAKLLHGVGTRLPTATRPECATVVSNPRISCSRKVRRGSRTSPGFRTRPQWRSHGPHRHTRHTPLSRARSAEPRQRSAGRGLRRLRARRHSARNAHEPDTVRRFLAGEPIVARPVSTGAQLFRWARRRPALA